MFLFPHTIAASPSWLGSRVDISGGFCSYYRGNPGFSCRTQRSSFLFPDGPAAGSCGWIRPTHRDQSLSFNFTWIRILLHFTRVLTHCSVISPKSACSCFCLFGDLQKEWKWMIGENKVAPHFRGGRVWHTFLYARTRKWSFSIGFIRVFDAT